MNKEMLNFPTVVAFTLFICGAFFAGYRCREITMFIVLPDNHMAYSLAMLKRIPEEYMQIQIINGSNYGLKFFCTDETGKIIGDWQGAAPKQIISLHNEWCKRLIEQEIKKGKK